MKLRLLAASLLLLLCAGVAHADEIDLLGKIDKTPPVISDVSVSAISIDTVTITWTTDEVADSIVRYGVAPHVNERDAQSTFVLTHSVTLTGLEPGTGYSFCVEGRDMANNFASSCDLSFATDSPVVTDTIPPTILDLQVADIATSTATVTWTTDEIANGQVEYGTTTAYGSTTALSGTFDIDHGVTLSGLLPSTTYHARVHSSDDSGNSAVSDDVTFTTNAVVVPPPPGPAISAIESQTGTVKAVISWVTDVPTDAQVEYGDDDRYGHTTLQQTALNTSHVALIIGLASNTLYHGRIRARDANGTLTLSDDFIFQTIRDEGEVTVPPVTGGGDVTPPPTTPPTSGGGSAIPGGNGALILGGGGAPVPSAPTPKVQNVAAYGLDHTVILTWTKPSPQSSVAAQIVRSDVRYPTAPADGTLVYSGSGRIFTDINLTNNKTYYYAIFNGEGSTTPVELSIAPVANPNTYSTVRIDTNKISILTTTDFGVGTRGAVVEYLQKLLATDPALYPEGLVTGYYGPLTEAAVRRFQKANHIPETGIVDAAVRAVAENMTLNQQVAQATGSRTNLTIGSRGESVKVLQIALVQFGYLTDDSITGYYGPLTRAAVAKFQSDNNITPAAGYFGPKTRAVMFTLTSTSTPSH